MTTLDYLPDSPATRRSPREEFWNFATHACACLLAVVGAAVMIPAFASRPPLLLASTIVYLLMTIAVFANSALSHYFRDPRLRSFFRRLDQAFIYLLITASYTPFSLAFQDGSAWSWFILAFMWSIALAGFVSKIAFAHRVEYVAVWMYLALGWSLAFGGLPFIGLIPRETISLIICGGLFYTGGTYFLLNDDKRWYFHAVWHLFVVAGSVTFYLTMMIYI